MNYCFWLRIEIFITPEAVTRGFLSVTLFLPEIIFMKALKRAEGQTMKPAEGKLAS